MIWTKTTKKGASLETATASHGIHLEVQPREDGRYAWLVTFNQSAVSFGTRSTVDEAKLAAELIASRILEPR
jgi:hypothetical protein